MRVALRIQNQRSPRFFLTPLRRQGKGILILEFTEFISDVRIRLNSLLDRIDE